MSSIRAPSDIQKSTKILHGDDCSSGLAETFCKYMCLIACIPPSPQGFPGGTLVKNPPANAEDTRDAGSIPGSGSSPGEGNGYPLQHSCLGNPMGRGAWRATVYGVAKSRTRLTTKHSTAHREYSYLIMVLFKSRGSLCPVYTSKTLSFLTILPVQCKVGIFSWNVLFCFNDK